MPEAWRQFAVAAAAEAGFPGFQPDACLINRYAPASKMALHQDKDEADLAAPIVSLSLGLPAVFQFGGLQRGDPVLRVPSWQAMWWSGEARPACVSMASCRSRPNPVEPPAATTSPSAKH